MTEICKRCSRSQRLAWSVSDALWNVVVPEQFIDWILCLECFAELADARHPAMTLDDIKLYGLVFDNNADGNSQHT